MVVVTFYSHFISISLSLVFHEHIFPLLFSSLLSIYSFSFNYLYYFSLSYFPLPSFTFRGEGFIFQSLLSLLHIHPFNFCFCFTFSLSSSRFSLSLFPILVHQFRPICASGLLGNGIYIGLFLYVE